MLNLVPIASRLRLQQDTIKKGINGIVKYRSHYYL